MKIDLTKKKISKCLAVILMVSLIWYSPTNNEAASENVVDINSSISTNNIESVSSMDITKSINQVTYDINEKLMEQYKIYRTEMYTPIEIEVLDINSIINDISTSPQRIYCNDVEDEIIKDFMTKFLHKEIEEEEVEVKIKEPEFKFTVSGCCAYSMYVKEGVQTTLRTEPRTTDKNIIKTLNEFEEVVVIGHVNILWEKVFYKESQIYGYVLLPDISDISYDSKTYNHEWDGTVLTSAHGRIDGPSGSETYYNLDMTKIVARLDRMGYEGEYWIREDGCKMYGDYILIATSFEIRPIGTLVETSLGTGIAADTGGFAKKNPYQIDIATNWQ